MIRGEDTDPEDTWDRLGYWNILWVSHGMLCRKYVMGLGSIENRTSETSETIDFPMTNIGLSGESHAP